jgi:hypothetical protein
MLVAILTRYPCLPAAHQPLSKGGQMPNAAADQRLLEEALAEHRRENKRQLDLFLADPNRLRENQTGWRLSLLEGDLEWLLQILNDIRVGSWVNLGSPEDPYQGLNEKTALHVELMDMCGYYQMQLLAGLRVPNPPGRASE